MEEKAQKDTEELQRKRKSVNDDEQKGSCNWCWDMEKDCGWPTEGKPKSCFGCFKAKYVCRINRENVSGNKDRKKRKVEERERKRNRRYKVR